MYLEVKSHLSNEPFDVVKLKNLSELMEAWQKNVEQSLFQSKNFKVNVNLILPEDETTPSKTGWFYNYVYTYIHIIPVELAHIWSLGLWFRPRLSGSIS